MAVYGVPEGRDVRHGRRPMAGVPGRPSGALAIVVLARVPVSAQNRHADLAFIAALRGNLLYFPVFSAKTRNTPRAATQQKNPARHAVRVPGVVSENTFFWKILVTRVKRGIELPLSP
jgi:hypothetical protein